MRAVRILASVIDGFVVGDKVPSVGVVNVTIAVVVDPIIGDLTRIRPDIWSQIRVTGIDSLIDNTDHDAAGSRQIRIPRSLGVGPILVRGSSGTGGPWRITAIHPPQAAVGVIGVVADGGGLVDVIGLDEFYAGIGFEACHGRLHRHAIANPQALHGSEPGVLHGSGLHSLRHLQPHSGSSSIASGQGRAGVVLHKQLTCDKLGTALARQKHAGFQNFRCCWTSVLTESISPAVPLTHKTCVLPIGPRRPIKIPPNTSLRLD